MGRPNTRYPVVHRIVRDVVRVLRVAVVRRVGGHAFVETLLLPDVDYTVRSLLLQQFLKLLVLHENVANYFFDCLRLRLLFVVLFGFRRWRARVFVADRLDDRALGLDRG